MNIFTRRETRSINNESSFSIATAPFNTVTSYTSATAIENSDIFSGVNRIASDIASLELQYRLKNITQDSDNLTYLFNVKPNKYYNGYQLKFIIVANILLNGETFIEVIRDNKGKAIELYHIKNSQVTYKQDASTKYELIYEVIGNNRIRRVKAENMLHFRFFSLDGITGISPLRALKEDIDTQRNSKRFLNNFFKNGNQQGGILTYKDGKLNKEARDKLKEEWQKANAGTNEAHKVVVLDATMDYEAIEIDTEILKLVNTSNFTSEQIAKVLKIPPHMFGLTTTNMKLEEMNNSYVINTLNPYLQAITSEIRFKLGNEIRSYKFDMDAFKFVDIETKTKVVKERVSMGAISLNEARKEFGDEPIDNDMYDKHYMNLNHVPLEVLEQYQMGKTKHNPIGGESEKDE